ncbi:MAG: sensor histidine kinase [Opitutus sp.]
MNPAIWSTPIEPLSNGNKSGRAVARQGAWTRCLLLRPGPLGAMIVLGCELLFGATTARGIDNIRGLPFSRIYSLEDVGYVPRDSRLNFDSFGRVAVIHEGVYAVLNDTAWTNLANLDDPAHYPISEVVHAGPGQTYYCGRASWGSAEFGSDGKLHAKSLVPVDPPTWTQTTTFDTIIVTADGVYFTSPAGVAFWDFATKQCQLFEMPQMAAAIAVGDKVYVSSFDQGLRAIDVKGHSVQPASGTELDQHVATFSAKLDETRTLVAFMEGPPRIFDGVSVTPWHTQDTVDLTGRISALARLPDGNIAIAVTGRGVFVLTPEGNLVLSLTIPEYHRVSSIASRERGVLWLLTENSVEKVLYQGGLTSFGQRLGLPLSGPLVATWHDQLFVVSGTILYEAISGTRGATTRFQPLKSQPPGGAWVLAAAGPHLLIGNRAEIHSLGPDGNWRPIARVGDLRQLVMIGDDRCYAIGKAEIAFLQWDGQQWTEPVPRIPGLRNPALAHRAGQSAWVEMAGDGVARLSVKDGQLHAMILPNKPWTQALWVNIGVVNDTVVLSPAREKRRFFDERTEQWCERPELVRLLERPPHWINRMWNDEAGTIWATHIEGLVRFTPKGGDYDIDFSSFDLINARYPNVQILGGNDVWVTAGNSLHHVEPVASPAVPVYPKPVLVSLNDTRRNQSLLPSRSPQSTPLVLPFAQNSLSFQFFSGSYAWRRAPAYEYRLSANEPWAAIDTGSSLRFPALHEGKYHLQVRIGGRRKVPGTPLDFNFEILPPWHRTSRAYVGYSVLGLLAVLGFTRWSGHLARRRYRVLEQIVQQRTGELESAMKKLNEETRVTATLAERDRLAVEIHDTVQQGLSGAILQLDTTLKLPAANGDLRARLDVVRNMVSYARQEVQHAVWDLDSPLLEGNDLGDALRKLTTFTDLSTVVPIVVISGSPVPLPRLTTHHLLRIAQEATANAVRHAKSDRITLELEYDADSVVLTITDDGIGFDANDALNKRGHFGLRGIRGRATKLGGEFTIHSALDAGTSIRVVVPLTPGKIITRHAEALRPQ